MNKLLSIWGVLNIGCAFGVLFLYINAHWTTLCGYMLTFNMAVVITLLAKLADDVIENLPTPAIKDPKFTI